MEPTASRVAILPQRNPSERNPIAGIAGTRAAGEGCTVHWFRRDSDPRRRAAAKRVAILDPYAIEERLLIALAQAHGHHVTVHRDADDLLASFADAPPQIAFVHICFGPALRAAADALPQLPPIVLIDSRGVTGRDQGQLVPIGDFTALRFPIGLREFAEAIRRTAR